MEARIDKVNNCRACEFLSGVYKYFHGFDTFYDAVARYGGA